MQKHIDVHITENYPHREKLNSAEVGQRFLDLMRKNKNRLSHTALLDDARAEDSPLHPAFEWDDGKAAEQYRIQQADLLARSVFITIRQPESESPKGTPTTVRVSILPEKQQDRTVYVAQVTQEYRRDTTPTQKPDLAQEILAELRAFKHKYGAVGMVQPVIAAIDEVLARSDRRAA